MTDMHARAPFLGAVGLTAALVLGACNSDAPTGGAIDAGPEAGAAGTGGNLSDAASDTSTPDVSADADVDSAMSTLDAAMGVDAAVALPLGKVNPWIAFSQVVGGFGELAFVKADATGFKSFKGTGHETDPAWSPDGTKLAFAQYMPGVGNSVHVLDFETGEDRELTADFYLLNRPRFSPDGNTLVVAGTNANVSVSSLFRVDVATGAIEQLTASAEGDGGHDIAADGTVFFVRRHDTSGFDVFSVPYTAGPTTTPTPVTTGASVLGGVSLHPDGKRLYYARSGAVSTDLIELTLATSGERTIGDAGDEAPSPFVDGAKLVLSRESFGGNPEIVVTDLDGTLIKRCTDDTIVDATPATSPLESDAIDLSPF